MDNTETLDINEFDVTATDSSDTVGIASAVIVGAAAIAAGAVVGRYAVAPVVGWIGSWFAPRPMTFDEYAAKYMVYTDHLLDLQ